MSPANILPRFKKFTNYGVLLMTFAIFFYAWKTGNITTQVFLIMSNTRYQSLGILERMEADGLEPVLKSIKRTDSAEPTLNRIAEILKLTPSTSHSNSQTNSQSNSKSNDNQGLKMVIQKKTNELTIATSLDGIPEADLIRLDVPLNINPTNSPLVVPNVVPNIVHYIWLGSFHEFTFTCYLSFLSIHRFVSPTHIFVHGNYEPFGEWWNRTLHEVDNIYLVYKVPPSVAPSGKDWAYVEHSTDYMRLDVICKYGGIYLDTDMFVLKSLTPLMKYKAVIGRERSDGCPMSIVLAAPRSQFYELVKEQYNYYKGPGKENWANRAVEIPATLARNYSSLVHVEDSSLLRPSWYELNQIYKMRINWSTKYAMHLWYHSLWMENNGLPVANRTKLANTVADIDCLDTTYGEVTRYIYYGSAQLKCSAR